MKYCAKLSIGLSKNQPFFCCFVEELIDEETNQADDLDSRFVVGHEKKSEDVVLSTLAIKTVDNSSFGLYRCRAKSPIGFSELDFTLTG